MAQTLPNGTIVPNADGGEQISETGVAEMRTLGTSVDGALGDKASLAQLALKADKSQVDDLAGRVFFRGAIPLNSNLDTWLTDEYSGLWRTTASASPTLSGVPEQHQGQPFQILHMGSAARVSTQILIPYGFYSTTMLSRSVDNVTDSTWTEWAPMGTNGGVESLSPYAQHAARQTLMVSALGGPIDTGGKAAVALRFDHGLANFRDKVLPAVQARGIKVSMAYNPRRWHLAENSGVTPTILNGWVAAGDIEIWNHSATHVAAEDPDSLYDEIVNGLAEIEAELPAARGQVWGFNPPGFTGGDYMGFNDGRTPEGWGTHAGQLILTHHAVASGYLAGTQIRPLDGTIRDGQSHYTMDSMTVAQVKAHVDAAIAQGGGLQLMLHPSQLDTADRMTTAQFVEILDYIVSKRTAGELVTLSPYEMAVADSTRPDLAARLAALEYRSGPRNVTALFPSITTGSIITSRAGRMVTTTFYGVRPNEWPSGSSFLHLDTFMPAGFRPERGHLPMNPAENSGGVGRVRIAGGSGQVTFYGGSSTMTFYATLTYPTDDPAPALPPGSAA